jgi:hypothetical protein
MLYAKDVDVSGQASTTRTNIKKHFSYILASKIQEKPPALKSEHPTLQNMKFLQFNLFCESFLPFCIRIQPPKISDGPFGSGSTTLLLRM